MKTRIILSLMLIGVVIMCGCVENYQGDAPMAQSPTPEPDVIQFRLINRTLEPATSMYLTCEENGNKYTSPPIKVELEYDATTHKRGYRRTNQESINNNVGILNLDFYSVSDGSMWVVDYDVFDNISEQLYSKYEDNEINCKFRMSPPRMVIREDVYVGCSCNITDECIDPGRKMWLYSDTDYEHYFPQDAWNIQLYRYTMRGDMKYAIDALSQKLSVEATGYLQGRYVTWHHEDVLHKDV